MAAQKKMNTEVSLNRKYGGIHHGLMAVSSIHSPTGPYYTFECSNLISKVLFPNSLIELTRDFRIDFRRVILWLLEGGIGTYHLH